jgi:uncharacterized iron-regulated membrane protein
MTNPRIINRRLHRWGAILVALPFLVVLCTGILLQLKKQLPWVQPVEQRGATTADGLSLGAMMDSVRTVGHAGIASWDDVDRIDVRPSKGLIKVIGNSRWEVQLDAGTGAVVQTAYRRSDLIESLHDGSFFHPLAKLGVFLPAGVIVLGLWVTGIYLFVLPYIARRKNAARRREARPIEARPHERVVATLNENQP